MVTSSLNLPPLGVVVIWEWQWEDKIVNVADGDVSDTTEIDEVTHMSQSDEVVTHISETDFSDERC